MGAPMYLLGLTITVGAIVSIPFLYVSDWIVDKVLNNKIVQYGVLLLSRVVVLVLTSTNLAVSSMYSGVLVNTAVTHTMFSFANFCIC